DVTSYVTADRAVARHYPTSHREASDQMRADRESGPSARSQVRKCAGYTLRRRDRRGDDQGGNVHQPSGSVAECGHPLGRAERVAARDRAGRRGPGHGLISTASLCGTNRNERATIEGTCGGVTKPDSAPSALSAPA